MKSNIQKVYSKLPKVELSEVELATQKVELAGNIKKLLGYYKGVNTFGKNIDISIKEFLDAKNSLKVDSDDLWEDMKVVAEGMRLSTGAAKELGINVKDIPDYNNALEAYKYGIEQGNKAKKILK